MRLSSVRRSRQINCCKGQGSGSSGGKRLARFPSHLKSSPQADDDGRCCHGNRRLNEQRVSSKPAGLGSGQKWALAPPPCPLVRGPIYRPFKRRFPLPVPAPRSCGLTPWLRLTGSLDRQKWNIPVARADDRIRLISVEAATHAVTPVFQSHRSV